MIYLKLTQLISSGFERDCWAHPENPSLCVKTTRIRKEKRNQNQQEFNYYTWLVNKGLHIPYIPKIYGWCESNHGQGLIIERICNEDGSYSVDLPTSLKNQYISPTQGLELVQQMFIPFLQHGVIVSDECPTNFFVQRHSIQPKLLVIDGLGHRHINLKSKLRDCCQFLANRKTQETKQHLIRFLRNYDQQSIA